MRVLSQSFRLYCDTKELENTIQFYEELQRTICVRRLQVAGAGIEVAVVGSFIVLAGGQKALEPVRDVQAVFFVESLDDAVVWLKQKGASIVHGPKEAIGGRNLKARHPDGLVVEYYQAAICP